MHDEPRGLGDDDEVVVLVAHHDVDRRVGHRPARHLGLGEHFDHAPGLELAALGHPLAVDQHRSRLHEILDLTARPPGEQRDGAVEPLPRQRVGNHELLSHRHARCAPSRSSRRSRRSARTAQITMRIAPMVIAESATLNVGKSLDVHEVDHRAAEEARRAEQPVHQVAEGTTEHQRQPHDHQRVAGAADRPHEDHRHHDGDDGEQGRERLEQAERAAGVAHHHEPDVVADQPDGIVRQLLDRPPLAQLVERHDAQDDRGREERAPGSYRTGVGDGPGRSRCR